MRPCSCAGHRRRGRDQTKPLVGNQDWRKALGKSGRAIISRSRSCSPLGQGTSRASTFIRCTWAWTTTFSAGSIQPPQQRTATKGKTQRPCAGVTAAGGDSQPKGLHGMCTIGGIGESASGGFCVACPSFALLISLWRDGSLQQASGGFCVASRSFTVLSRGRQTFCCSSE